MKLGDRPKLTAFVLLLTLLGAPSSLAQSSESSSDDAPRGRPKLDCTAVGDRTAFGHFAYPEIPRRALVTVGNGILLNPPTARSFLAMQRAAARDGVVLVPLSGFRDTDVQRDLFFGGAAARGQTLQQRARVSAPPGFSEHHTGYAVDIGDATAPGTDLTQRFDRTAAGRWLFARAGEFGFELSFPPSHPCVSYEPWHWRWVGDEASQRMFDAARDIVR